MTGSYSDINKKQKKKFLIFLMIYLLGFLLLNFIGDRINDDGYLLIAFIAPFTVLVGIIGITWNFYVGSDLRKDQETKDR